MPLWLTGDPDADHLLDTDPFALLVGMLLDQQVPMEAAFVGPRKLADRMGGLDVRRIAEMNPDEFVLIATQPPAIHRFARSMAGRVQALARDLVDDYDGDPTRIWTDDTPDAPTVLHRLEALPGFGAEKSRIFLALLGKQRGVTPRGWREATAPFGEPGTTRSVADITDKQSLLEVRATKKAIKAGART
jgi:uncharacterized HhH-GPD family protein